MDPKFDRIARMAVGSVTNLMGETAVWQSSQRGEVTGRVLFKDPTEPVQIGDLEGYEYRPGEATAEFYRDQLVGLKQAVDEERTEYLTIRGRTWLVVGVDRKFDGGMYVAHLTPHEEENDGDDGTEL